MFSCSSSSSSSSYRSLFRSGESAFVLVEQKKKTKRTPKCTNTTFVVNNKSNTNDKIVVEGKVKPDWAGDDILSRVVDSAISNKFLYEVIMKPMARKRFGH